MFAELIDGTANSNLWLIVALIIAVVLCAYRAFVVRAVDGALVAAIIVFVLAAAIDAF